MQSKRYADAILSRTKQIMLLTLLLWAWCGAVPAQTDVPLRPARAATSDVRPLPLDEPVERPLKAKEQHIYGVNLAARQALRVGVREQGVDVVLLLFRAVGDDPQLIEMVDFDDGYGREDLTFVAEQAEEMFVAVVGAEGPLSGDYQLAAQVSVATTNDRKRIRAGRLLAEGRALQNIGDAANLQAALEKWRDALALWQQINEPYWAGYAGNLLGLAYNNLGKKQQALQYFQDSLPFRRVTGDRHGEAATLLNIGNIYSAFGEQQKALQYIQDALALLLVVGDRQGAAYALNSVGGVYSILGEQQKALQYFQEALPLSQAIEDRRAEAMTLHNLGEAYSALGEKQDRKSVV